MLATLRVSREKKKVEREEKVWREENPLLVWVERNVSPLESEASLNESRHTQNQALLMKCPS